MQTTYISTMQKHPICLSTVQTVRCASSLHRSLTVPQYCKTLCVPFEHRAQRLSTAKHLCVPFEHRTQCLHTAKYLCVPHNHRAQSISAAGPLCVPPDHRAQRLNVAKHPCVSSDSRTQHLKAMKHLCVPPPQRSGHIALMGQSKHRQRQFPCCLSLPVTAPCAVLRESSSQQEIR